MSRAKYDPRRAQLYEMAQRYARYEGLIDEHEQAARQPGLPIKAARWHERKARALRKHLHRSLDAAKELTRD